MLLSTHESLPFLLIMNLPHMMALRKPRQYNTISNENCTPKASSFLGAVVSVLLQPYLRYYKANHVPVTLGLE